ncbi:MAG TPA: hypothetical protein VFE33_06525 [Thermoanaerobaculia bacterium]|nr:hypothetical protein [Thermoanaerobaculia bacterium]
MSKLTKILLAAVLAVAVLGGLHTWLNLRLGKGASAPRTGTTKQARFRVGFLPVT